MDEPTNEQLKQLYTDIMSGLVMTVTTEHYKQLEAKNTQLQEQIVVMYDEAQAENVTLMGKNEQLQAEKEKLKELLSIYADHLPTCQGMVDSFTQECDCGLEEARNGKMIGEG